MLIDRAGKFDLVIPNRDGSAHLKRCLDYLVEAGYRGRIVVADSSRDAQGEFVTGCTRTYPQLQLELLQFGPETGYFEKVRRTLEILSAEYVMLAANDDFIVPETIEALVAYLDAHPDYSAARGRVPMFHLAKGAGDAGAEIKLTVMPYPMRPYEQDTASERLLAHIRNFATTLNSVHRRESLTRACRLTTERTQNVIFEQYLCSGLAAVEGKIYCSNDVYYVRQAHANSVAARMKQGDYEHWPMLFVSPHYSRYYQEFRQALCDEFSARALPGAAGLGAGVDAAFVDLLQRNFRGKEAGNTDEMTFQQRATTPGTSEHAAFIKCVNFAVRYPDSY